MNERRSRRVDNNFYTNIERQRANRNRNVEVFFRKNFFQHSLPRFDEQTRFINNNPRTFSSLQMRRAPIRNPPRRQLREMNYVEPRRFEYQPRAQVSRRREKRYNPQTVPVRRNEKRANRRKGISLVSPLKISISNLSPETINEDLVTIFGIYGRLKRCAVFFKNGTSTCRGVVQYTKQDCANRAFNDLNKTVHKGNVIILEFDSRGHKKNNKSNNQGQSNGPQQTQAQA